MIFRTICFTALTAIALHGNARVFESSDSRVRDLVVENTESTLSLNFTLDLSNLRLKSDREIALAPVLTSGDSTVTLPKIIVAGRNRYIQNQRKHPLAPGEMLIKPGTVVQYKTTVPLQNWMKTSTLTLAEDHCGCGFTVTSSDISPLAAVDLAERLFQPAWSYATPKVETRKSRSASGSAYIDFPVNRTEIFPQYRRNPAELAAIRDTIDQIKSDPDSRIETITIVGYASPEGPYAGNERLAKGRTEALAAHVRALFTFPDTVMRTSYVPEDWDGLIRYIENSTIENRDRILALITDNTLQPDALEWKLKTTFPEQYRLLLQNVYPGLRHSDYTINYVISSFTDPEKIAQILRQDPRKLSLHEMYVLAQTLPAGSDEYREVFEVAVRMYPDAPEANLNAAMTALSFNDLTNAARYLDKAGNTPQAAYGRAILAAKQNHYRQAETMFRQLEGTTEADKAADALAQLRAMGKIQ